MESKKSKVSSIASEVLDGFCEGMEDGSGNLTFALAVYGAAAFGLASVGLTPNIDLESQLVVAGLGVATGASWGALAGTATSGIYGAARAGYKIWKGQTNENKKKATILIGAGESAKQKQKPTPTPSNEKIGTQFNLSNFGL